MNWVVRVLLVSCLLISPPPSSGQTLQAVLEEPNFDYVATWELHFALGIVATIETDEGVLYLAYPILDQRPVNNCKPYRKVGHEVYLLEDGNQFVVSESPSLYRVNNQDWKMWDELRREFEE